jgi:CelD/BcsL family acetyltransferase involved in cellulose biosynthesis
VVNITQSAELLMSAHVNARGHSRAALEVLFAPLTDVPRLAVDWLNLEKRARPSFFISWSWIHNWLTTLPGTVQPHLLMVRSGGQIVGLSALVVRNLFRHRVMPVKAMYLHSTGAKSIDVIAIEYNDFLVDEYQGDAIRAAMLGYLSGLRDLWEELSLPGVANAATLRNCLRPTFTCHEVTRPVYEVDLRAVRARNGDYLRLVGTDTRYKIKRSLRRYAESGPVQLQIAEDVDRALQYLQELKQFHNAYWRGRGMEGAFYSDYANTFHQRLVEQGVQGGYVQLAKISAGTRTIGYLYNFVHCRRVYAYQSGIDYASFKGTHPGLVMHALAVEVNARMDHAVYDFMAGEYRYKRSMSTGTRNLVWLTMQRPLLKLKSEAFLRRAKWWLIGLSEKKQN